MSTLSPNTRLTVRVEAIRPVAEIQSLWQFMIEDEASALGRWITRPASMASEPISDDVVVADHIIGELADRAELDRLLCEWTRTDETIDHVPRDVIRHLRLQLR